MRHAAFNTLQMLTPASSDSLYSPATASALSTKVSSMLVSSSKRGCCSNVACFAAAAAGAAAGASTPAAWGCSVTSGAAGATDKVGMGSSPLALAAVQTAVRQVQLSAQQAERHVTLRRLRA